MTFGTIISTIEKIIRKETAGKRECEKVERCGGVTALQYETRCSNNPNSHENCGYYHLTKTK